jgi:hypothetical protein
MCQAHRPHDRKPRKPRKSKKMHDDICICKHNVDLHDMFGCKKCDTLRAAGRKSLGCTRFQAQSGKLIPEDEDFKNRVKEYGFIKHEDEIATCTICWMSIKIGPLGTVSSVMGARAHALPCKERTEKLVRSRQLERPNRAG